MGCGPKRGCPTEDEVGPKRVWPEEGVAHGVWDVAQYRVVTHRKGGMRDGLECV